LWNKKGIYLEVGEVVKGLIGKRTGKEEVYVKRKYRLAN
jgi:hypothetical protein